MSKYQQLLEKFTAGDILSREELIEIVKGQSQAIEDLAAGALPQISTRRLHQAIRNIVVNEWGITRADVKEWMRESAKAAVEAEFAKMFTQDWAIRQITTRADTAIRSALEAATKQYVKEFMDTNFDIEGKVVRKGK